MGPWPQIEDSFVVLLWVCVCEAGKVYHQVLKISSAKSFWSLDCTQIIWNYHFCSAHLFFCIPNGTGCPILAPKAAYDSTEIQVTMQNSTNQLIPQKYSFCCCSLALFVLWFCTQLTWKSGGTSKRSTGSHPLTNSYGSLCSKSLYPANMETWWDIKEGYR